MMCLPFAQLLAHWSVGAVARGMRAGTNCFDLPTKSLLGFLQEIPTGQGNRVRAEIYGLHEQLCNDANDLLTFFDFCFNQRSTASTNMNATSSRSHALFTITVRRVVVSVGDGVDRNLRAMVRTEGIESKLHLVDLAGAC